jgi:purine-binding chemotaxis protein CheW
MAERPNDESKCLEAAQPAEQKVMAKLQQAVHGTKAETLKARRRALATQRRNVVVEETAEVVEFLLGEDLFSFELEKLSEVCPLIGLTWIPGSPSFVLGVINLRGQIVPIIDLRSFLGVETSAVQVFNKALIFRKGKLVVGFLADEVIGARKVALSQMQHSVGMLCGATADFVKAVTADRLIMLDAEKVLSDSRLNRECNFEVT